MDTLASGENRSHLISRFWHNGIATLNAKKQINGFFLPEFSRGLVVALTEQAGQALLQLKHSRKFTKSMIPEQNKKGIEILNNLGCVKNEICTRMIRGNENIWSPQFIYSYAGGYCG